MTARHHTQAKVDRRVGRTRNRLALALRELIQQRTLDDITVQDVLDRAGVGRSTFYSHFRNKADLFLSDLDEFLAGVANHLCRSREASQRLLPVRELFTHVGEMRPLYAALSRSLRLSDFDEMAREHFARGIDERLRQLPRARGLGTLQRKALAHALAGSVVAQLDWWLRSGRKLSPEAMDRLFHQLAWSGIAGEPANVKR